MKFLRSAPNPSNNEQQDNQPPLLTAAAQELINNEIRGSTKVRYKSKVGVSAGGSYKTICGYHSEIAGQNVNVGGISLARTIFIDRPQLPRYTDCWKNNQDLKYLETGPSLTNLSDIDLSIKTATIAFILTL